MISCDLFLINFTTSDMKKPFIFTVVIVFCVHLCGYYSYYFFKTVQLHCDRFERLENKSAEKFRLTKDQFSQALVDDEEIELHGKMFDIIKTVTLDDSVEVYAYRDNEEEQLINFITSVVSFDDQSRGQAPHQVLQFFDLTFLASTFSFNAIEPIRQSELSNFLSIPYHKILAGVIKPPPRNSTALLA